jgi:5'-nucleotidase
VIVDAMNLLGYDAMSLGETDLQLGDAVLRERLKDARFPVLSANLVVQSTGELLTAPYALRNVGGRKVGIIGLAASDASQMMPSLSVVDPAVALRRYVQELQEQTDIIVVLSNLEWAANVQLADTVPGVDLIISAGGSELLTERWQSPKTGTLVCQLGVYAREHPGWTVSMVQIRVDDSGRITDYSGSFVEFGPEFADDPEMRALLDSYETR